MANILSFIVNLIRREKLLTAVCLGFLLLTSILILSIPVKRIDISTSDDLYTKGIIYKSAYSKHKKTFEEASLSIYKRVSFDLPFIIKSEKIDVTLNATAVVHQYKFFLIHKKSAVGSFTINPGDFKKYNLERKYKYNLYNRDLSIALSNHLAFENVPRLLLKEISIIPSDRSGYFKRTFEYLLPILIYQSLLIIMILIALNSRAMKILLISLSNSIFLVIGLFSTTLILTLSSILVPLTAFIILAAITLYLLKRLNLINVLRDKKRIPTVLLLMATGSIFWLTLTFHPSHYHPDFKVHLNWSREADNKPASQFIDEYSYFQMKVLLGLNARFPYSPSFYLAVAALSANDISLRFWIRFLPIIILILLIPMLYTSIITISNSDLMANLGGLFYLFNGISVIRILLFFYPAIWGGFFIMAASLFLLIRSKDYRLHHRFRWYVPEILFLTAGFIAYPSGPLCIGAISLILLAIWSISKNDRKENLKSWLKIFIPSIITANVLYYGWYFKDIFQKVIPGLNRLSVSGTTSAPSETIIERLDGIFGTWLVFIIALIGFFILLKNIHDSNRKSVLMAWGLSWLLLFSTRFFPPIYALFKFGKEFVFIWPLFAISLAYPIASLWKKQGRYRLLSLLLSMIAFIGFILIFLKTYPRCFI